MDGVERKSPQKSWLRTSHSVYAAPARPGFLTTYVAGVVGSVAGYLGGANFWNPGGWVAGAISVAAGVISVGALGLSCFFSEREEKLQKGKPRPPSA
jgi:hypothetical protein